MFLALFTQVAIVLPLYIMSTRKRQRETETQEKDIHPLPVLNLTLTPHGDNATSIYLEVENLGDTINLSAQLRIVGRSPIKLYKTYAFCGRWKSEPTIDFHEQQLESYVGDVRLESNKSRLLTIASLVSIESLADQEMTIEGIDGESIVWDTSSEQSQELPYFIIQVTLIAKGHTEPLNTTYQVGPKTIHGPFHMTEVPA